MDYLYSLYDALIGINVPTDKARAVVDAMERDMGTTLATKSDVQLLRQEMATKTEMAELRQGSALIRKDIEILSARMDMLSTTITVRLGSGMMMGLGLLFAALKMT
jgi:hypothetical protein